MEKQHNTLSDSQRVYLTELLSKGTMQVGKQKRIQGLLYLATGKSCQPVSKLLTVNYATLSAWAKSYAATRLAFLDEPPRSGRPIKFEGAERAKVTALACSKAPWVIGNGLCPC